jgi:hypothetical protein
MRLGMIRGNIDGLLPKNGFYLFIICLVDIGMLFFFYRCMYHLFVFENVYL